MNLENTAVDSSEVCLLSISAVQNITLMGSNHHPKYFNASVNLCFCGNNWVRLNITGTIHYVLRLYKAGRCCMKYDKCPYATVYAEVRNKINIEM